MSDKMNAVRKRFHEANSELNYHLEVFGDELAKKNGYKDINGIEAIWMYFIKTYHWTPAYVKSMPYEDMRFVLSQEFYGFVVKT